MPRCWFVARSDVKPKPSPPLNFLDITAKTEGTKARGPPQPGATESGAALRRALHLERAVGSRCPRVAEAGREPGGCYLTRFSTEYTEM